MPEPAKPTPGPWRVDTTKVFGPYHVITVSKEVPQSECIICAFPSYRRNHKEHRPRLEADARLIAAAHDLLEACVSILAVGEAWDQPEDENQRIYLGKSSIAKLRAAIAKTKGTTP